MAAGPRYSAGVLRFPLIHPPLLGPDLPLPPLGRLEFCSAGREPDLAVCVATGDDRLYANILLTVGYIAPPS